ncbi:MAG TPA: hypothetical protein PLP25_09525 [Candidatus Limiplasma sp.]|nr:hypothetical protein [Candidatus Limiplasma sp.]HPS82082.1 hypothetical protein [Candidatus Limiplasma sp.]
MNVFPPQAEVRAALGEGCFVKRSDDPAAFFISDAPRRFAADRLTQAEQALLQRGFTCAETPNALWRIDFTEARWQMLSERFGAVAPTAFPARESMHGVYALARLLRAHAAPWPAQPREMLRLMLQNWNQPVAMETQAARWTGDCAQRLRDRLPLPSAGAGILFAYIRREEENPT